MAQLIDGKAISKQIKDELKEQVAELSAKGVKICLAVIQVGNDPASSVYVGNKKKACAYIGIDSLSYELPEETTEEELLELIDKLNKDDAVNEIQKDLNPIGDFTFLPFSSERKIYAQKVWDVLSDYIS